MKRLLHIGLLLMVLAGLIGQSTAMAMVPANSTEQDQKPMALMAGMECADMSTAPLPGTAPCKKVTIQCMAAMGCSPLALTQPVTRSTDIDRREELKSVIGAVANLKGRTIGPEPDPPSLLI